MNRLKELQRKPIPDLRKVRDGYRSYPLDLSDPRIHEPVDDIRNYGLRGRNLTFCTDMPPYYLRIPGAIEGLFTRIDTIRRLVQIEEFFNRNDLRLDIYDGLRPMAVQNYLHDVWFPNRIRAKYPHLTEKQVVGETERYCARGAASYEEIDVNSPPPHSAAAVDLTIARINGSHFEMGCIVDDFETKKGTGVLANTAHFERTLKKQGYLTIAQEEALRNRRLLYWIMMESGIITNPNEYWHVSYGDQMWAKLTGAPFAFYSKTPIPEQLLIV